MTRPRRWAIGLVAAYALLAAVLGLVVPRIAREPLRALLDDAIPARVELAGLSLNPFTMEIGVRGLAVRDEGGGDIVRLASADIDLEAWASLLGVVEIGSVRLEGLEILVEIEESGRLNLMALVPLEDPDEAAIDDEGGDDDGALLPMRVERLEIASGRVGFVDRTRPVAFVAEIDPIELGLFEFSTLRDERGRLRVDASGARGLSLSTELELTLEPLSVAGSLNVEGVGHALLADYLGPDAAVQVESGSLSAQGRFRIEASADDVVVRIDDGEVRADRWRITSDLPWLAGVDLEAFGIDGLELSLADQTLSVREISLRSPRVAALRPSGAAGGSNGAANENDDGASESDGGAGGDAAAETPEAPEAQATGLAGGWTVRVERLGITDGWLTLAEPDARETPVLELGPLELEALELGNEPGRSGRIEASLSLPSAPGQRGEPTAPPHLVVQGELSPAPASAGLDIELDDLPLAPLGPLFGLAPDVRIAAGTLSASSRLEGSWPEDAAPDLSLRADLTLRGLSVTQGAAASGSEAPGRHVIGVDRVEVHGLVASDSGRRVRVGRVRVVAPELRVERLADGSLNLARLRTAPAPSTGAEAETDAVPDVGTERVEIEGGRVSYRDATPARAFAVDLEQISGVIERKPGAPAGSLSIQAKVDGSAPIRLDGRFTGARHVTADLQLEGMNATRLGPYFEQYLGNEVEQGKLSLDLQYEIDGHRLEGSNAVRFDQLLFGPRTNSPDAVNLPIPLAFKLLTDPKGRARLQLDIQGDLDDPGFNLRSLVTAAFVKVIRQALSSPLAVLQTAMPDLTANTELRFAFAAGRSELDIEQETQLASLASLLASEPKLSVRIKGRIDPELDAAALASADEGGPASEEVLRELGERRAHAIRDELVVRGGVDAKRVFVRSLDMQGHADAGRIAVDVTLTDD